MEKKIKVKMSKKEKRWYQLGVEQVFEVLESGSAGLSSSESKARLEIYGYNELKFKKAPFGCKSIVAKAKHWMVPVR